MNALHRIAFRLRAMRIDLLRAERAEIDHSIIKLENKQRASLDRRIARLATRTRTPSEQ